MPALYSPAEPPSESQIALDRRIHGLAALYLTALVERMSREHPWTRVHALFIVDLPMDGIVIRRAKPAGCSPWHGHHKDGPNSMLGDDL